MVVADQQNRDLRQANVNFVEEELADKTFGLVEANVFDWGMIRWHGTKDVFPLPEDIKTYVSVTLAGSFRLMLIKIRELTLWKSWRVDTSGMLNYVEDVKNPTIGTSVTTIIALCGMMQRSHPTRMLLEEQITADVLEPPQST